MVLKKLLHTPFPQHPLSAGATHQVPTVPAIVTWTQFYTYNTATLVHIARTFSKQNSLCTYLDDLLGEVEREAH